MRDLIDKVAIEGLCAPTDLIVGMFMGIVVEYAWPTKSLTDLAISGLLFGLWAVLSRLIRRKVGKV